MLETPGTKKRVQRLLPFAIIGLAVGLRLINLEADFPLNVTWSGVIYTDEGWYSSAAIHQVTTGHWYSEGDFNPAVNLPVFQAVQWAMFTCLGMSLAVARLTVVIFFAMLAVCLYVFMRRHTDYLTSLLAILLLCTNMVMFAYSRLAILEVPMLALVLLSMCLVTCACVPSATLRVALAAIVFALAMLTKTTALFGLPLVLYLIWTDQTRLRRRLWLDGLFLMVMIVPQAVHFALANAFYAADYQYFVWLNIISRSSLQPSAWLAGLASTILDGEAVGRFLYPLGLGVGLTFFCFSRTYRSNQAVRVAVIWLISGWLMLSVTSYHPPRYYLSLLLPVLMLLSCALALAVRHLEPSAWVYLPLTAVAVILLVHTGQTLVYLAQPRYTFLDMARAITARAQQDGQPRAWLVGNLANTVSLATGLPSINSWLGTRPLRWRLERYRPSYYLSLGIEEDTLQELSQLYQVERLASFDVFSNYLHGKQVHFYRLQPHASPPGPDRDAGERLTPELLAGRTNYD